MGNSNSATPTPTPKPIKSGKLKSPREVDDIGSLISLAPINTTPYTRRLKELYKSIELYVKTDSIDNPTFKYHVSWVSDDDLKMLHTHFDSKSLSASIERGMLTIVKTGPVVLATTA